ncbi:jacalin-like lectin [Tropicimonas sp. S265A]|uniref:jacalin-like lectin n=1 Tax=Tropicimonas sp. S265A TaxID=3415134 RepID=UPI003C7AF348
MTIETLAFGGEGGAPFDIQPVASIGFRTRAGIAAMDLNGMLYGAKGADPGSTLVLQTDEYIANMAIYSEDRVNGIRLMTNHGRGLSAGTFTGHEKKLTAIRVIGLGGNCGSALDKIRIRYVKAHTGSRLVDRGRLAVLAVIPQGRKFEAPMSNRIAHLAAVRHLSRTVFDTPPGDKTGPLLSGAKAEFMARTNATFGLSVTSQIAFDEQTAPEVAQGLCELYVPPPGMLGLQVVAVDVFKAHTAEGPLWFFPVTRPSIVSVPAGGRAALQENLFDLTGSLQRFFPDMAKAHRLRDGYHHYETEPALA